MTGSPWVEAVVERVWLQGFESNLGILWDGFAYAVGTGTTDTFRYASIIHGGPGALINDGDNEINGIMGTRADFQPPVIPEPETYVLMLAGLGAVGFFTRRKKTPEIDPATIAVCLVASSSGDEAHIRQHPAGQRDEDEADDDPAQNGGWAHGCLRMRSEPRCQWRKHGVDQANPARSFLGLQEKHRVVRAGGRDAVSPESSTGRPRR
jgi:hypothetical protein